MTGALPIARFIPYVSTVEEARKHIIAVFQSFDLTREDGGQDELWLSFDRLSTAAIDPKITRKAIAELTREGRLARRTRPKGQGGELYKLTTPLDRLAEES